MISILKQWPLPKGIKKFIYEKTDYQTNKTQKVSRFVSCIEIYNGKPVKRVFGFISASQFRNYEDIKVKEVARYYNHKQYLGYVSCNLYSGYKEVHYDAHPDRFDEWRGEWWFWDYPMTDPEEFLKQNGFTYTGWNKNCDMEFHEYLTRYIENPKVELLSKAGLGHWTKYIRYLDTSKRSLHEIFKIRQECVPLLKEMDFNELMICRKTGLSDINQIRAKVALDHKRKEMLRQYDQNFHKEDIIIKVINDEKTTAYCAKHYSYYFVHDYIDYLKDLHRIGAITDRRMLYPENFQEAHQAVNRKIRQAEVEKLLEGFSKQYEEFKKFLYEKNGLMIRPVKEPNELYSESEELNHCVRTYDRNVAAGITEIMFIRKTEDPDKPYYTLELKDKKVIQVRGKDNMDPAEDVQSFVSNWAKQFKITYTAEQPHYGYY